MIEYNGDVALGWKMMHSHKRILINLNITASGLERTCESDLCLHTKEDYQFNDKLHSLNTLILRFKGQ